MSRFYASIQGNRGMATRQGFESSGIHSHTRGWNVGIRVFGSVNDTGEDEFRVILTGGSQGAKSDRRLGTFTVKDLDK